MEYVEKRLKKIYDAKKEAEKLNIVFDFEYDRSKSIVCPSNINVDKKEFFEYNVGEQLVDDARCVSVKERIGIMAQQGIYPNLPENEHFDFVGEDVDMSKEDRTRDYDYDLVDYHNDMRRLKKKHEESKRKAARIKKEREDKEKADYEDWKRNQQDSEGTKKSAKKVETSE